MARKHAQNHKPEQRRGTKVLARKGVKRTEVTGVDETGLVLRGKAVAIPPVTLDDDGLPVLPVPEGLVVEPSISTHRPRRRRRVP